MKTLQRKIITLLIFCTFFVAVTVEFVSLSIVNRALQRDSAQIMTLMCANQAGELNDYLHSVEQSVNTMYRVALKGLEERANLFENETGFVEYLEEVASISGILADHTEGAIAVYYRLNPEIAGPIAGFFNIKLDGDEFISYPVTDLSMYEESEKEHVFWYYEPIRAKKPIWLDPYSNENIGVEMISYVAPIFYRGETIGVVGMDIDITSWREKIQEISLYETGFAALLDSTGNVIYHPEFKQGVTREENPEAVERINFYVDDSLKQDEQYAYRLDAQERAMVADKLDNGMTFVVVVPWNEINQPSSFIMAETILIAAGIMIICSVFGIRICKRIINLAHTDVMTGTKNKAAYEDEVEQISQEIRDENAEFAVLMFDINNLKQTNDTYGHDEGDKLIITVSDLLMTIYGKENVFRIGGDEFIALLRGEDAQNYREKVSEFTDSLELLNKNSNFVWKEIQVAVGATGYRAGKDAAYGDVFRRVDSLMYKNKKEQKEQKEE